MRSFLGIIFILLVVLIAGCDQDPECNQSTVSGVKFTFIKNTHFEDIQVVDTVYDADSLSYDLVVRDTTVKISRPSSPVWFHSAGSSQDTVYSTDAEVQQLLPLTAGLGSLTFRMNYGDESDDIIFYYSDEVSFLDIPCGFIANFYLDSIAHTTNIIDSVQFLSPEADNDVSTENIIIYYY